MRRRSEELGCLGQVDIPGMTPHFLGGSSFFLGTSPLLKKKKSEPKYQVLWVEEKNREGPSG